MTNSMLPAEGVSASAAASSFFRWEVPEKPFLVNFSLDVLDRLEREVIESFKAVTKRGSEIGGVLLGRAARSARRIITVESFRTVECEYTRGPLYLLSDADKLRLDETITSATTSAAGLSVVGFFRSNTRRDLLLDEEDLALIQEYFASPDNAFLLVKPFAMKPSVAGFFFWEDGRIHRESTYLQFPFRRSELVKGWAQAITAGAEQAAPERPLPVAVPKREERVPVAAPPERTVAPPISIKREEPPPPKPEPPEAAPAVAPPPPKVAERPAPPPVQARIQPPPPPPAPEKREQPFVPPPVAKREEPAPVVTARREERLAAAPLAFKREEKPPITPVVPKREEPVARREERPVVVPAPPKREERPVVVPPAAKREERPAPAVTLRERPAVALRPEPQPVAKKEEKPILVKEPPAPPTKEEAPPAALVPAKIEPPPAPVPAARSVLAVEAPGAEPAPSLVSRLANNRWLWLSLVVLLVAAGAAVKFLGTGKTPDTKPAESSLGLRVERNAGQFVLTWNRESELIQTAQRATLTISDGDHKEDVDLDLGQLRSGSIFYSPMTSDVSFRLEVTDLKRGKSLSESVRWLAGRPSPSVAMTQGQQVVVPPPVTTEKAPEVPAAAPAKPAESTEAAVTQPAPVPTPPPAQAPTPTAQASSAPAEPPKVTAAPPKPESLAARLSAPPPPPPQLSEPPSLAGAGSGAITSSMPAAAMRQSAAPPPPREAPKPAAPKVGGHVVEAKLIPTSRVIPAYPPLARQARVSGAVKVQASIGADGRVTKAVAISGPPLLRQAAVEAVMRWRYEPSRLNGLPVESTTEVDVGFNLGTR